MTTREPSHRTPFEGLRKILQFNWPFYTAGLAVLVAGSLLLLYTRSLLPPLVTMTGVAGLLLGGWWLLASLAASHWIYDRAGIYRFDWMPFPEPENGAILTAGFDEAAPGLRAKWPNTTWACFDFYEEHTMTEPSIRRARNRYPPAENWILCSAEKWPVESDSFDMIVFPFSAHELRKTDERIALLSEAKRVLRPEGRIVLLEHVRNLPNAVVFGPGVFHFHSVKTWTNTFVGAGFPLFRSRSIGGLVKAFFLEEGSSG